MPCSSVDVEIEPFSSTPVEKWKASKVTLPESTMAALERKPKRKSNPFIVGKTIAKIIIHLSKGNRIFTIINH